MIPLVTRLVFASIMSAAAVALIAGCGTSGSTGTSSANLQVTKAQAVAYAHAVNLRAGDVAGTKITRNAEVVIAPSGASRFLRCAGIPGANLLIEMHSAVLSAHYWWMQSNVGVMPNNALAAAYVSSIGSSHGRRCLAATSANSLHATLSPLAAPPPIVGIRATSTAGGYPSIHTDTFAFASGRVVVALNAQGLHTPPLKIAQHVASLLYSRAETYKL